MISYTVRTDWQGQTRSLARAVDMTLAGVKTNRTFAMPADEPAELLGEDTAPNPQELLFAGLNACMIATFVIGAAIRGVKLTSLAIETSGELDLRGFLGIDAAVKPGYDTIRYRLIVSGDGTPEQYEEIHRNCQRVSPNRFNLAMPVNFEGSVQVI
ncbi:osmotically inducible protein C [Chitinimonas sp. BJB300]|nr:osmotically inducible protein C [Chitinimonas sp. BJB300]TSJ91649.1 OsmC family protein [Chitinimonas sp. BJB300]